MARGSSTRADTGYTDQAFENLLPIMCLTANWTHHKFTGVDITVLLKMYYSLEDSWQSTGLYCIVCVKDNTYMYTQYNLQDCTQYSPVLLYYVCVYWLLHIYIYTVYFLYNVNVVFFKNVSLKSFIYSYLKSHENMCTGRKSAV